MSYFCYLCLKRRSSENKIILHSFPRKDAVRQQWINACGLSATDELKNTKICSKHFVQQYDYNVAGKSLRLGAVPSIGIPGPSIAEDRMKQPYQKFLPQNHNISERSLQLGAIKIEDDQSIQCDQASSSSSTSKRSRFAEPRFVSEITINDVATPERASRVIELVQKTIKKKNKVIKALRDSTRYLKKRIRSLDKSTAHSRKKNLMNTDAREKELSDAQLIDSQRSPCLSNIKVEIELSETELIIPDYPKGEYKEGKFSDIKHKPIEPQEFINATSAGATMCLFDTNIIQKELVSSAKIMFPSDVTIKQEPLESHDNIVNPGFSETSIEYVGDKIVKLDSLPSSSSNTIAEEDKQKSKDESIKTLQKEVENLRVLVHSLRSKNKILRKKNNNLKKKNI